jgi:hypothetical protein
VTAVHAEVTGAPSQYVNCSFVEVPPGSIFVAGTAVEADRMVGLIRQGRSEEIKRKLITALAVMENGQLLPEASEDRK